MSTAISVNKQSVEQLLGSGKAKPFIIPDYQRPYAWSIEQVQTLFEDLWEFTALNGGTNNDGTYFLGSIVSYENDNGEQEIIDGQQRITSLFLLLRAIYTNLSNVDKKTEAAKNFINKIEPAIWRTDKLTGKVDYSNILLQSKVLNNEGNDIFKNILKTGHADPTSKDNYSTNYRHFQKLFESHSLENPIMIYEFIYALLNQAILLPISADSQDTALTIFSTLNDRGLPLSDADIFKAKIYNELPDNKKNEFIERWKELDEKANNCSESIQTLFYYYMFYLRALSGDGKSTTPGLRKYYSEEKFKKLKEDNLLFNIEKILNIWIVINSREIIEDESWSQNIEILQSLDILSSYPNEFWKYPVVLYYLSHRKNEDFEINFLKMLKKLIVSLLTCYLVMPTINAVKSDIMKLNLEIIKFEIPKFEFNKINLGNLDSKIRNPHKNVVRMILKIISYNDQDTLLPKKWEIEHIFPRKWQKNYFPSENETLIREKIECIGNKIPLEKIINITAGAGYFLKKKSDYSKSDIMIAKKIGTLETDSWSMQNIDERSIRISDKILEQFEMWNREYTPTLNNQDILLTDEEKNVLKKLKLKGVIQ